MIAEVHIRYIRVRMSYSMKFIEWIIELHAAFETYSIARAIIKYGFSISEIDFWAWKRLNIPMRFGQCSMWFVFHHIHIHICIKQQSTGWLEMVSYNSIWYLSHFILAISANNWHGILPISYSVGMGNIQFVHNSLRRSNV